MHRTQKLVYASGICICVLCFYASSPIVFPMGASVGDFQAEMSSGTGLRWNEVNPGTQKNSSAPEKSVPIRSSSKVAPGINGSFTESSNGTVHFFDVPDSSTAPWRETTISASLTAASNISSTVHQEFLIYEDKCRIRNYDHKNQSIQKKFFSKKLKWCPKKAKPFVFYPKLNLTAGLSCIGFDEAAFKKFHGGGFRNWNCTYKEILRDLKKEIIDRHYVFGEKRETTPGDCPKEEFIWIECERSGTNQTYQQPLMMPKVKQTRVPIQSNNAGRKPLHVLVLGLDSVSRLNAHRQLPKTLKFLQTKKNLIELFGYNKIGLNSAPNQIPLLTGIPYASSGLRSRVQSNYFDNKTRFLWEGYEERGFRTMYYEEKHVYGLFVYPTMKGFKKVPTTYWPRPLIQAIERSALRRAGGDLCIGQHLPAKFYLDYTYDTMKILGKDRPLFSYQFLVEAAHDDLNGGQRVDGYFRDFFAKMDASGILNNTAVFFISDHGYRFGEFRKTPMGRYEDMLPYGFVLMPEHYFKVYPDALKNIRTNSRRLVTVYDLHATLRELADPWNEGRLIRTANGYSILSSVIPSNRSCEDAGIDFQFCACFETKSYDKSSNLSRSLANFVIDKINDVIRENNATAKCQKWSLSEIVDFVRLSEGNQWTNFYKSTIKTNPAAEFEVTARFTQSDQSWKLLSRIDRLSWFRTHAKCVERQSYERYCYCK